MKALKITAAVLLAAILAFLLVVALATLVKAKATVPAESAADRQAMCREVSTLAPVVFQARAVGGTEADVLRIMPDFPDALSQNRADAVVHLAFSWPVAPQGSEYYDMLTAADIRRAAYHQCLGDAK